MNRELQLLLAAPPGPLAGLCNVESADLFGLRFSLRHASKAFGGVTAAARSDADAGAAAAAHADGHANGCAPLAGGAV